MSENSKFGNVETTIIDQSDYVLQKHDQVVMGDKNRKVNIIYKVNYDKNSDDIFRFCLALEFIDDKELNPEEKAQIILFDGDQNDDETIIYIRLKNWLVNHSWRMFPVDIISERKRILDFGNGMSLYVKLRIHSMPASSNYLDSHIVDIFTYSHYDPDGMEANNNDD